MYPSSCHSSKQFINIMISSLGKAVWRKIDKANDNDKVLTCHKMENAAKCRKHIATPNWNFFTDQKRITYEVILSVDRVKTKSVLLKNSIYILLNIYLHKKNLQWAFLSIEITFVQCESRIHGKLEIKHLILINNVIKKMV